MIQARSALAWLLPTLIGAIGRGFIRRQACFGVNLSDVKWSGWRWLCVSNVELPSCVWCLQAIWVAESRVMSSSHLGCRHQKFWCVLLRPAVLVYIWVEVRGLRWPRPCGDQIVKLSVFVSVSKLSSRGLVVVLICLGLTIIFSYPWPIDGKIFFICAGYLMFRWTWMFF